MTLKTTILAAATVAAVSLVDASTTVTVMELGKGGVVRRTTTESSETSVRAVKSFWTALHTSSHKLQHAGMTVVPDLFNRAESGLVVGLTGNGVDLAAMPTVSSLVEEEGKSGVVGHMKVPGSHSRTLLEEAGPKLKVVDASALASTKAQSGFHAISVEVHGENAANVDAEVSNLINSLSKQANDADTTVVLHLVLEDKERAAGRRRLEDEQGEGEEGEEGEEEEGNEEEGEGENEDGEAQENNGGNNQNAYYGYGYYNDDGEWVTPYKTMFQIQYFNVVLWTSIALFVATVYSIYLMVGMPLMADTLLFGESAKMMGD